MHTDGLMTNFTIDSYLNLESKNIKARVDVAFLKDFSKAIKYIPLVGYIIMGDDGEFHTAIDIKGTLDHPKIKTHTVKNMSKGIQGVIKRILTLPLKPFTDTKK